MHSYLGAKPFEDGLKVQALPDGNVQGEVSVPGAWTTPVLDFRETDSTHFQFAIEPNEGSGKFHVDYFCEMDAKKDVIIGWLRLQNGEVLGGFVGERPTQANPSPKA